jgi:hypothetical protein
VAVIYASAIYYLTNRMKRVIITTKVPMKGGKNNIKVQTATLSFEILL